MERACGNKLHGDAHAGVIFRRKKPSIVSNQLLIGVSIFFFRFVEGRAGWMDEGQEKSCTRGGTERIEVIKEDPTFEMSVPAGRRRVPHWFKHSSIHFLIEAEGISMGEFL